MRRLIFLAFILFLMSGPSLVAQDVRYNFDSKADFSKFKTYKWVDIKGADKPNPLVQKQSTDTIEAELAKKGLTKTDSDTADLLIGYQTAVGTEKQFSSYNTGWGYGPGWGGGWDGGGGMTTTPGSTSTIYVDQLDLDIDNCTFKDQVVTATPPYTPSPHPNPTNPHTHLPQSHKHASH